MELGFKKRTQESKPVIMLVVDTLMDQPLQEAINKNQAPAFNFLIEKGSYIPDVVSPFPTMSVNVDTTLLTGTYCNHHHLPGLVWFNGKENRLINYGSAFPELIKLGLSRSLEDILFNMNECHISKRVRTIHEELEDKEKSSASINTLVYRGNIPYRYKLPKFIQWFTTIQKDRFAFGPKGFTYGGLKKISPSKRYQHLWQKLGFNDAFSIEELTYLIEKEQLPSFTIVYMPELDHRVHKYGRMDIKGIAKADLHLQRIFNLFPSWEEALQNYVWITMGDNGQAWIDSERKKALIDLRKILGSYTIMKLRRGVQPNDQIVLAVNERMAYIYTLDINTVPINKLVSEVENDVRIDVIAWREGKYIRVKSGVKKGEFRFHEGGTFIDPYNQTWLIEDNEEILDITLQKNQIFYGDYPDALARIYSCIHSHEGNFLIVSAKPGYEFIGEGSPTHVGGASHGGLHKQDSLVPIIINGTDTIPSYPRIVNLKEWILELIG